MGKSECCLVVTGETRFMCLESCTGMRIAIDNIAMGLSLSLSFSLAPPPILGSDAHYPPSSLFVYTRYTHLRWPLAHKHVTNLNGQELSSRIAQILSFL